MHDIFITSLFIQVKMTELTAEVEKVDSQDDIEAVKKALGAEFKIFYFSYIYSKSSNSSDLLTSSSVLSTD